ncbi:type 2 periplasmic-binding domain-containing protein [Neobacillus dielmonensis]|uniref:hypothetical protein n=1 Tax=Neobacillus dielmonensis TaxID=1347369 RepID=UPI0005A89038|nr:hypothetical protein [Neobacillus dielmonensis]
MPKIILGFNEKHSHITVDLDIRQDGEIEELFRLGVVDVGITLIPRDDHFSLRIRKVSDDQLIGTKPPFAIQPTTLFIADDIPLLMEEQTGLQTKRVFSTEAVKQFVIGGMGCVKIFCRVGSILWQIKILGWLRHIFSNNKRDHPPS